MNPLFLASQSPRRAALLSQLGLVFQVLKPKARESRITDSTDVGIIQLAEQNALEKAQSVLDSVQDGLILSGDTMVVTQNNQVLGKPTTAQEALVMLKGLVGTWHRVISAVAVISANTKKARVDHVWTTVTFRKVPIDALKCYIAIQEPLGKAGGYAIQGKGMFLIEKIDGSHSAVIGLPLELVVSLLMDHGVEVWHYWMG
ncbi:MAG: Maf family protein [Candidatus Hodarchaeota archaeon]